MKIFVDLAVLATGDSPMEREKVHSFHTASLGFASLIFIPKKIQFSQFIKRLKDLEENFEGDLNLNEKLVNFILVVCIFSYKEVIVPAYFK